LVVQQQLERQRKLRILRVSNRGDPITLCPEIPYNWCLRSYIKANFRHVGMKLLLRPRWRGAYEIYHPIAAQKTAWYFCVCQFFQSLKHAFFVFVICLPTTCLTTCSDGRFLINIHGIHEYLWRVNKNMGLFCVEKSEQSHTRNNETLREILFTKSRD
jgi:hypothetical protein